MYPEDKGSIDLREMGNLVLNRVRELSQAINAELLEPISRWLSDSNFLDRFAVEPETANWAGYKRVQRQWSKQQRALAGQRLINYRQEMLKRRTLRRSIPKLIPVFTEMKHRSAGQNFSTGGLNQIIAPFSPNEQRRQETALEFTQAKGLSLSNLLPWRLMLFDEIKGKECVGFDALRNILVENRQEKIAKFRHLLQMDSDGEISLEQRGPDYVITIKIHESPTNSEIVIKDQQGRSYEFDWLSLSKSQKNKVIADVLDNKILCRAPMES